MSKPGIEIREVVDLRGDLAIEIKEEATEDSDHFRVKLRAIRAGWSKRGRYWKMKHLEQIKTLLENRRKMYVDHEDEEKNIIRRSHDWVAVIENEQYWIGKSEDEKGVERDTLFVVADVAKEGEGRVVRERIRKWPDQVDTSIHAFATMEHGEAEGQTGDLIEDVVGFGSLDFVLYQSAGGGVAKESAAAPVQEAAAKADGAKTIGAATLESFYWVRKSEYNKDGPYLSLSLRMQPLQASAFFKEMDDGEAVLSVTSPFTKEDAAFREMLSLASKQEDWKGTHTTSGHGAPTQEVSEVSDIKTLAELKAAHPDLVREAEESAVTGAKEGFNTDVASKAVQEDLKATKEKLEASEVASKKLQEDLDEVKADKVKAERESFIVTTLTAAGFSVVEGEGIEPTMVVPDAFLKVLRAAEDEDAIKALVEDRKNLVAAAAKTDEGMGSPEDKGGSGKAPAATKEDGKGKTYAEMNEDERKALAKDATVREDGITMIT